MNRCGWRDIHEHAKDAPKEAVRLDGLGQLDGQAASIVGDADGCKLEHPRVRDGQVVVHMPGYAAAVVRLERVR